MDAITRYAFEVERLADRLTTAEANRDHMTMRTIGRELDDAVTNLRWALESVDQRAALARLAHRGHLGDASRPDRGAAVVARGLAAHPDTPRRKTLDELFAGGGA